MAKNAKKMKTAGKFIFSRTSNKQKAIIWVLGYLVKKEKLGIWYLGICIAEVKGQVDSQVRGQVGGIMSPKTLPNFYIIPPHFQ